MGTDVPVAPTAPRARGWSCRVSLAPSAPCPAPAPACPARLARPVALLAPCSPSAAPEVSAGLLHAPNSAGRTSGGFLSALRGFAGAWSEPSIAPSPLVLSSVSSPRTGYYCPGRSAAPLPCPEGTLNPSEGALAPTACRQCPVGRYCRGEANWEPDGEFG